MVLLCVAMLTAVYATFYNICPEYWMLIAPFLFVVTRPIVAAIVYVGMMSVAWAVNFFFGVAFAVARPEGPTPGKMVFVRMYDAVFAPVAAETAHTISVAFFELLSVGLAVYLTWHLLCRANASHDRAT